MIPTFVIYLREGIEASMIVAILLSYLSQINQRKYFRDVFVGVGAAFVLILVGGIAAYLLISRYSGSNVQAYFETVTYLIAAAFLTVMTFWMHKHARTMSAELRARGEIALSKGNRFGLSVLAFQAVGREGLETMVFTLALVFAGSRQAATPQTGHQLLVGAALGLLVALVMAFAIYKLGARVNLRRFFRVLGVLLMLFAAGLLADAAQNLQSLGWLPFAHQILWNSSGALAEGSNLGDVLHSLVGYADQPTLLQGIVWALYVLVSVSIFVTLSRAPRRVSSPATPLPTSSAR